MPAQPLPLMPKATAVWLINNTTLSFEQIGDFCGLHRLEVQAIADGDAAQGIVGLDPLVNGQLTMDEIKRCEEDEKGRLKLLHQDLPTPVTRSKGPRYTPVTMRGDKPDGVAWLLKNYPQLGDGPIARLIGTTRDTIEKVRNRTHWNAANLKPRNPVLLGLCSQTDLTNAVAKADRAIARAQKKADREARRAAEAMNPQDMTAEDMTAEEGTAEDMAAEDMTTEDMASTTQDGISEETRTNAAEQTSGDDGEAAA